MPTRWEWIVTEPSGRVRRVIAPTKTAVIDALAIDENIPIDYIRKHFKIKRGGTVGKQRGSSRIEDV